MAGTCEHCGQGPAMCDCCDKGCLYAASLHCNDCGECACQGGCGTTRTSPVKDARSLGIIIP